MKQLISKQQVQEGVHRLAVAIKDWYGRQPLTIIGIMTGSIVLLADLIRQLEMPLRVGVVQASSYRGGTERGAVVLNAEMMPDILGRDVLLVDDIFDTGHTLLEIVRQMERMGPRSLKTAVLLRKLGRQAVALQPDFVAFDIPNVFVVGYGLDYRDAFRNLPYIAALEPEDLVNDPA